MLGCDPLPYIFILNHNLPLFHELTGGRQFQIHHLFGQNHADCEPLTSEDSYIMKDIFGGERSWDRRAAIIWIDGQPVACSMAGMPHGTSQDIYGLFLQVNIQYNTKKIIECSALTICQRIRLVINC